MAISRGRHQGDSVGEGGGGGGVLQGQQRHSELMLQKETSRPFAPSEGLQRFAGFDLIKKDLLPVEHVNR